jgi:ketosteroid isomerase-like protein
MSQENVEIIRRFLERVTARDVPGVIELVSDDISCFPARDELEAEAFRGSEALAEYLRDWFDVFEHYEVEVSEYVNLGEHVVAVGRVTAHGSGSGARVAADDAWLYRLRDGKVVEYRECGSKTRALEAAAQMRR